MAHPTPAVNTEERMRIGFVQCTPARGVVKWVSTPTGIISHFVNLQVVVPEAFILGSGELHVDMGSTINLVCIIEKSEPIY
uniref:Ig-like domain-containing protein n=1 Tax=Anopheles minimus TaxID=112268 RepID=A0A182WCG0_9DIPT